MVEDKIKKIRRYSDLVKNIPHYIKTFDSPTPKYIVSDFLGSGSFGKCYKISSLNADKSFACKVMSKTIIDDAGYNHHIANELTIHPRLKHPFIVQFIEYFEFGDHLYIVQSLCSNKSLRDLLKIRNTVSVDECRYFIHQLLQGVAYMHDNDVIHRDIKLTNILLDDKLQIKICDFGLAIYNNDPRLQKKHVCGTTNYLSPEVLDNKGFTFGADIWAVGVVTFMLLFGKTPFENDGTSIQKQHIKTANLKIPDTANADTVAFVKSLLEPVLSQRPTAKECLDNFFFTTHFIPDTLPIEIFNQTYKPDPSPINMHAFMPDETRISFQAQPKAIASIPNDCTNNNDNTMASDSIEFPTIKIIAENCPAALPETSNTRLTLKELHRRFNAICQHNLMRDYLNDNLKDNSDLRPKICVSNWLFDSKMEKGFAYRMSDGSYGMLFTDRFKLIFTPYDEYWASEVDGNRMENISNTPRYDELKQKIDLFEGFYTRLFHMTCLKPSDVIECEYSYKRLKTPYIQAWFRTVEAIVMLLTDDTVQINFTKTHEKLLISQTNETITFIKTIDGVPTFTSMNFRSFAAATYSMNIFNMIKFFTSAMKYFIDKFYIDNDSYQLEF